MPTIARRARGLGVPPPVTPIASHLVERADARSVPLPDGVVACVVTSPPYLAQRVYGDSPAEIGRCGSVAAYVDQMVAVAAEVARVLDEHGVLWLNMADKANGSGGAGGDHTSGSKRAIGHYGSFLDPAYPRNQFLDVPGKVTEGLQRDGGLLRARITWDKGRNKPESLAHVRRPRLASEPILMLVRSGGYRFFPDHLAETGDVWHFPPGQPQAGGHFAPFPDELARRCILASTEPGDLVVDPFAGSGTTPRVAVELGRLGRGFDLYAPPRPPL